MNAVLKHCALVACCASSLFFASSSADAQTSFGRMRAAQRPAPETPDLGENDDAFDVDEEERDAAKPSSTSKATSKTTSKTTKTGAPKASTSTKQSATSQSTTAARRATAIQRSTNPARAAANSQTNKSTARKTTAKATETASKSSAAASNKTATNKLTASASSSKAKSNSDAGSSAATPSGKHGPKLGAPTSHKYRAGMIFGAQPGGSCSDVFGSAPVPMEFPEQKVRVLEEDFPKIAKVDYRDLKEGGARQLVFKMRELKEGNTVEATVLFEVTRYTILPPTHVDVYQIPKQVPADVKRYLKESKYMESNSKTIKTLVKETTKDIENAWDKVDAILAFVRDNIQYKEVLIEKQMRGALAALRSRDGDCEDMSALFISMCRALDVPARLVRVPGHCWAEFYLVDDEKVGYWFPAHVAGTDPLGGLQDTRVILQKGDSFKLPESPREEELYVKELFTGKVREGGPDPIHQFIQEVDGK